MDAFNVLGASSYGDVEASRRGMADLAAANSLAPEFLAQRAVDVAVQNIVAASRALVESINARPVYTLHELLDGRRIVPKKIYLMGGPAEVMKMPVFKAFQLSVSVPKNFSVANAVGAALTRTTRITSYNVCYTKLLRLKDKIASLS